ncbi:MAG: putative rane protein [Candidatus Adlerbacteria bacterium]|nr:putative rane protein [Candidatus Adlerbacteria bacterium]
MRKLGFWALIGGVIFAVVPVIVLLIAIVMAVANGCQLSEAAAYPCLIGGIDFGGLLGMMAMTGWLALFSVPVGGLVAAVGLVLYIIGRVMGRTQAPVPAPVAEDAVEIIAPGEQL